MNRIAKTIIHLLVFPFLLIAYLFYFFYWGIPFWLTGKLKKESEWEIKFLYVFGFVCLWILDGFFLPGLLAFINKAEEYLLLIIPLATAIIVTIATASIYEGTKKWEFPIYIFKKSKLFPKTTIYDQIRKAQHDRIYAELDKEFPGMEKE